MLILFYTCLNWSIIVHICSKLCQKWSKLTYTFCFSRTIEDAIIQHPEIKTELDSVKDENNSSEIVSVKVENASEKDSVKSEVSEPKEASEDKKRKLDEETPELPLDKKRKTEATELVPTGSGVFVVTDTDTKE